MKASEERDTKRIGRPLPFPIYIGSLLAAAVIRNVGFLGGKYVPSPKALFLLPLVSCVFTDIINSLLISLTLNML